MSFKKKIIALVGLVAIFLVTTAAWRETATITKLWSSEIRGLRTQSGTTTLTLHEPVLTDVKNMTPYVTLINDVAQFSTWAGDNVSVAASGDSYYQTVAGRTYVVDPVAILNSTGGLLGTASAVTFHLPLATSTNDYQTVKVLYAQRDSGTSATPVSFEVQVWPAPLAGTTTWATGANGGHPYGRQNMVGMATSGSSAMTTFSATGSYNINSVGEYGEWQMMNDSATSAVMLRSGVMTP